MSGPALKALGVHAVWSVSRLSALPILGVGGIAAGSDAVQYLLAGASLVQVGTASFWDPRAGSRVAEELGRFGADRGVDRVSDLIGGALPAGDEPGRLRVSDSLGRAEVARG